MDPPVAAQLDLPALLQGVEAAYPVEAVNVLARMLARMVGARDVSFLIADFSGDAPIRFVGTAGGASNSAGADQLARVSLSGSDYEQALLSQRVVVHHRGGSVRVYAPVTDRGQALGVLELELGSRPDEQTVSFIASAADVASRRPLAAGPGDQRTAVTSSRSSRCSR